ncbi:hypothetical protein ASG56_12485 [Rhodococcus sp. Leaf7]|uniref:ROK family transcriptional regulator n=1 Tax=unclassified Rhodococcus (in: high G+C Gram-positive bacteria) TaxID=192944 RepID=UPI000700BA57|nr:MULTISPECIES: ROK family protein [unclassified Rhodococcus (in: high G+C Gram-positive bacteria)]KQU04208.1 hypothetical protein ASG56_12485 [Rhodococcus sp. Leaf7]KQU40393.1 hypothetical protein ASG64_12480 [Rhodococcus sp. Leaf247]
MSVSTFAASTPARSPLGRPPHTRTGRARFARVVAPELRVSDTPAAVVFRAVVQRGPVSRDVIVGATGISTATVNRHVSALISAGLLRERADLSTSGAVGRPRVPVEVDHEGQCTLGVHIGATTTRIVAVDLRGTVLGGVEIPTPTGGHSGALRSIAESAAAFAARWHRRRILFVGVAIGGRVNAQKGTVDHPRLAWSDAPVGAVLGERLGAVVAVAPHVEAMAASELLLAPETADKDHTGTSLYFYAREMTGLALTIDGRVHTPAGGPGSIAHLPTGSSAVCDCGRTGCLEATVSDRSVLAAARASGLVDESERSISAVYLAARTGSPVAEQLLNDRADALGRALALVHDVVNPDSVQVGGQAFTAYPAAMERVEAAFAAASSVATSGRVRVTTFGKRVQDHAAAAVSLGSLYADPVVTMRKIDAQR